MKNLKLPFAIFLSFSVLLIACKKDETSTTVQSISGTYSYSNISNFEMSRYGAGGVEILLADSTRARYLAEANLTNEEALFTFMANNKLQIVDPVNQTTDTVIYKIDGNTVYVDVRDIPFFDEDYYPIFKISGNDLYVLSQKVELKNEFTYANTSITNAENYNLLDSVLVEEGYASLAGLGANDTLTSVKFRLNFKK